MVKLVVFGLAGTGTSTFGKALAAAIDATFKSSGNLFREMAQEHGVDLYTFEEYCREDDSYDKELDRRVAEYGRQHGHFVFESRLAWYFIPDACKIKLVCDDEVAIERVAERDGLGFDEAKQKTIQRTKTIEERYRAFYGIERFPPEDERFDLILDSTDQSVDTLVEKTLTMLREKRLL